MGGINYKIENTSKVIFHPQTMPAVGYVYTKFKEDRIISILLLSGDSE
ncbi:hypothetical protein NIES37_70720 (plasmid) [Tolypothrix tenuis PCC 7101]|uniref:Uncharacterized protein n=1 Tax=Tolypothrix tenuis PCC 7101 TaxID=231146 RepID=A0A1Z4NBF6_9CYAN|nr:hypothetical protein NIES37_70720 [Tolypothrix tenuis PCC 7101]BAZ78203.1 hypothetical protein NIES50_68360 [Aulosira laxa NIES-50]